MPLPQRILVSLSAALVLSSCSTTKPARKDVLPPQPAVAGNAAQIFQSLHVKQNMIPAHKVGRWKVRPMRPRYITIHSTQNFASSADADQHAKALNNGALRGHNSLGYLTWHFTVDDRHAVQHLPLNERGEHADFDGPGNLYSIGIEMCENRGSNRAATVDRAARLTAVLMHAYDIPLGNIVPHYHWPRYKYKDNPHKNCPHFLMDNGKPGKTWDYFLARVNYYAKSVDAGPACPQPQALQAYFERGSMVSRGFLAGLTGGRPPVQ